MRYGPNFSLTSCPRSSKIFGLSGGTEKRGRNSNYLYNCQSSGTCIFGVTDLVIQIVDILIPAVPYEQVIWIQNDKLIKNISIHSVEDKDVTNKFFQEPNKHEPIK